MQSVPATPFTGVAQSAFAAIGVAIGYQSLAHHCRATGVEQDRFLLVMIGEPVVVNGAVGQLAATLETHFLFLHALKRQLLFGKLCDKCHGVHLEWGHFIY